MTIYPPDEINPQVILISIYYITQLYKCKRLYEVNEFQDRISVEM